MSASKPLVAATVVNDEIDLLLLRMEYLAERVTHFYVSESPQTYSGRAKPLHVTNNLHRFAAYRDRMTVVRYDPPETITDPWEREAAALNSARERIVSDFPNAVGFFGDVDELPSPEQLDSMARLDQPATVPLDTYYRRANWRLEFESPILAPKAAPVGLLPADLNAFRLDRTTYRNVTGEPGVHATYMAYSGEQLVKKLQSFSHTEYLFLVPQADHLISVSDRLALDHLGRNRFAGHGLLTHEAPEQWSPLQRWLASRRPSWFADRPPRSPRAWRLAQAGVLDAAMERQSLDLLSVFGTPQILAHPVARRAAARAVRRYLQEGPA